MTSPLSYASQKCVLEHMEALKRLHFSSRCPKISRFEKSAPLRLKRLKFEAASTQINDVEYSVYEEAIDDENHFMPRSRNIVEFGDIPAADDFQIPKCRIHFYYSEEKMFSRRIPGIHEVHVAARTLNTLLLGGRGKILVEKFKLKMKKNQVLRLPIGLKIKAMNFVSRPTDFKMFLPLLGSLSQLKSIETSKIISKSMNHPIIQSAKKLILRARNFREAPDQNSINYIKNAPNRIVEIKNNNILSEDILDIMRHWLEKGKIIGSCFIASQCDEERIARILTDMVHRFKGKEVDMKEEQEPNEIPIPNTKYISIPMNLDSELIAYGIYHQNDPENPKIIFKVIPIGSFIPQASEVPKNPSEIVTQVFEKLHDETSEMEKKFRWIFWAVVCVLFSILLSICAGFIHETL